MESEVAAQDKITVRFKILTYVLSLDDGALRITKPIE